MLKQSLLVTALAALGSAVAVPVHEGDLFQRDSCIDIDHFKPVDGCYKTTCKEYLGDHEECPKKYMNEVSDGCEAFCPVRAGRYYGQWQYLDKTFCALSSSSCSVAQTLSYSFSVAASAAFNLGSLLTVTGGVTWGKIEGTTHTYQFPEGKCGFWALAPVTTNICGTLTNRKKTAMGWATGLVCGHDSETTDNTENVCVDVQVEDDGEPQVVVFPLYADCATQEFLQNKDQSDEYKRMYTAGLENPQGGCGIQKRFEPDTKPEYKGMDPAPHPLPTAP